MTLPIFSSSTRVPLQANSCKKIAVRLRALRKLSGVSGGGGGHRPSRRDFSGGSKTTTHLLECLQKLLGVIFYSIVRGRIVREKGAGISLRVGSPWSVVSVFRPLRCWIRMWMYSLVPTDSAVVLSTESTSSAKGSRGEINGQHFSARVG